MHVQLTKEHSHRELELLEFRISLGLNSLVFAIGVVMTAVVNRNMFMSNNQDLNDSDVFAVAFEQPLLSACLLILVCLLEGTLLWLWRTAGSKQFDCHPENQAQETALSVAQMPSEQP